VSKQQGSSAGEYESLISAAKSARENAHAAYSNFRVGAGIRATSGRIFGGCNVENATYGLTICAERVAIFKAISEGERGFWEFCGDVPVILANLQGKVETIQMKDLFPKPFDASNL